MQTSGTRASDRATPRMWIAFCIGGVVLLFVPGAFRAPEFGAEFGLSEAQFVLLAAAILVTTFLGLPLWTMSVQRMAPGGRGFWLEVGLVLVGSLFAGAAIGGLVLAAALLIVLFFGV